MSMTRGWSGDAEEGSSTGQAGRIAEKGLRGECKPQVIAALTFGGMKLKRPEGIHHLKRQTNRPKTTPRAVDERAARLY